MRDMNASLLAIHLGKIAPLGDRDHVKSAFVKQPVLGPVAVGDLGLLGDEQADLRVHGGPEKAVYAYPVGRYPGWQARHPAHKDRLQAGSLGENLVISGIDEASTCIGDIIRFGESGPILQVAQPRRPCFKLALRFDGDTSLSRTMTGEGWSGWYLRVLEPGELIAGMRLSLLERPNPAWSVQRFALLIARQSGTMAEMQELANLPGLAQQWREMAQKEIAAAV